MNLSRLLNRLAGQVRLLCKLSRALQKKPMNANEPNSNLTYSTQAEFKPSKTWFDSFHPSVH